MHCGVKSRAEMQFSMCFQSLVSRMFIETHWQSPSFDPQEALPLCSDLHPSSSFILRVLLLWLLRHWIAQLQLQASKASFLMHLKPHSALFMKRCEQRCDSSCLLAQEFVSLRQRLFSFVDCQPTSPDWAIQRSLDRTNMRRTPFKIRISRPQTDCWNAPDSMWTYPLKVLSPDFCFWGATNLGAPPAKRQTLGFLAQAHEGLRLRGIEKGIERGGGTMRTVLSHRFYHLSA